MTPLIVYYWKAFFLPPGLLIVILVLGLLLSFRWHRLGGYMLTLGILLLYLFSVPAVSNLLLYPLETEVAPLNLSNFNKQAQAIVVITGGNAYAPEYGGAAPSASSLARLRYAVTLYHADPLPIFIIGGKSGNEQFSESKVLAQILINGFKITPSEIESQSKTTYENAINLKPLLATRGIEHFYLVDSAWHLPRSLWVFRKVGLDPIPAPTDYLSHPIQPPGDIHQWEPNITALYSSTRALYEYFGLIEYRWRYSNVKS